MRRSLQKESNKKKNQERKGSKRPGHKRAVFGRFQDENVSKVSHNQPNGDLTSAVIF